MRYKVKIGSQASRDIVRIFEYIQDREQNSEPAEKFTNALVDAAFELGEFPYRGQIMKRRRKARRLLHGNYLIIFEVREEQKHIEILRFIHGAQIK
jgi:plasmid stabilization system protein ParE